MYKKKNQFLAIEWQFFFCARQTILLIYFEMHFENSFHLIGANI